MQWPVMFQVVTMQYLSNPYLHDKTHICPAESTWHTRAGDTRAAFDLPFARVGFNVCFSAGSMLCTLYVQNVAQSVSRGRS